MTTFGGFGPGKKGPIKTVYKLSPGAPERRGRRLTGIQHRFTPFLTHQIHEKDAAELGLERSSDKGTWIPTEKKLDEYMARQRARGRDCRWRDH